MKIKHLFVLAAAMFALGAGASTPFKNLYVTAEVYPSGAGEIYLSPKESDKDFVKAQSEGFGEFVELKVSIGENGSQDQYVDHTGYVLDASGDLGMYEAVIEIHPAEGYEFVCLATEISPTDIYDPSMCLQRHTGDRSADYEFFWNYMTDGRNFINVNSADHEVDMTSDEAGEGEDAHTLCFQNFPFSETPDRQLFAIFRKIGEETPCFEDGLESDLKGDANGDEEVTMEDAEFLTSYLIGMTPAEEVNLEYCDVNGDNEVNIADVLCIVNIVLKK